MPQPSIGSVVHYQNLGDAAGRYPPETQAAIITGAQRRDPHNDHSGACWEDCYVVDLHIIYRTGQFWMLDVPYGEQVESGHWRWPTRVG